MKQIYSFTKISILLVVLTFSQSVFSQTVCTIAHLENGTNLFNLEPRLSGQSFITECSGNLEYVQLVSDGEGPILAGTLFIYSGDTVTEEPIYTQEYPFRLIENAGDPIRIDVTNDLFLMDNTQYTFQFTVTSIDTLLDRDNNYPGGRTYSGDTPFPDTDFIFEVGIEEGEELSLSTEEFNRNQNVNLFPNPSSDFVEVSNIQGSQNYSIISSLGQIVVEGTITNGDKVDINAINNGVYYLKLEGGQTLTFIKE